MTSLSPINMLVVGECGDGKSTLINSLRNPQFSMAPLCGKNPEGVTKDIMLYRCPDLDGVPLNLIDTPGVGDGTITPVALIALLEEFLKQDMVPGGIRGVIVTTPTPDSRIKLGAQVVQVIVDKGFVAAEGRDKYANIILAGTKADKADQEEKDTFMKGTNGEKSVREVFFRLAVPPGQGVAVMVSRDNYTPLLEAIKKLPVVSILYRAPNAQVLASALAETLGLEPEDFAAELTDLRALVQQQAIHFRELMQQMHEKDQAHRLEMREHADRAARLMQQQDERAERLSQQHEERAVRMMKQHEEVRRQQAEQAAAAQRHHAEEMQRMQAQMQASAARTTKQHEEVRRQQAEQAAAAQRHHAEEMRRMQAQMQASFQRAREPVVVRREGGNCFPGSAVVETPSGPKPMTALRAGDEVLAVAASGELFFDEVYFFGHAEPCELGPYVWLHTSSGKALRASPRHFVPVAPPQGASESGGRAGWRGARYRYACAVQVGDELWVRGDGGHLVREAVLEVAGGTSQGALNPFTFSGTLVVDGVVASVHSDWLLDDVVPTRWVPSLHSIYQALLLPGRGLYRLLGPAAADLLEVNNPQGQRSPVTGTSHRAFAFFVASHLLPAAAVTAVALQRLVLG